MRRPNGSWEDVGEFDVRKGGMMEGIRSLDGVDVGDLYTDTRLRKECMEAWRVDSFCALPTIQLTNTQTKQTIRGAVGSLMFNTFVRLTPEGE